MTEHLHSALRPSSLHSKLRSRGVLSTGFAPNLFVIATILFLALPISARTAQDQKEPELRTVHGSVVDKDENPVASSVVYLKNVKTQGVKTYIADDSGEYRFSGLDPNIDYEIHAEHNDMTSSTRTISSYDSRRDINLVLKLAHKKSDHQ